MGKGRGIKEDGIGDSPLCKVLIIVGIILLLLIIIIIAVVLTIPERLEPQYHNFTVVSNYSCNSEQQLWVYMIGYFWEGGSDGRF